MIAFPPFWLFGRSKTVADDDEATTQLLEQAQQQEILLLQLIAGQSEANDLERQRLQLVTEQLHGPQSAPGSQ